MRFSRVVQMHQICDTLKEAAEYIQKHPTELLCKELLDNGNVMLDQLRSIMEQHQTDMLTTRPVELLEEIHNLWHLPLSADLETRLNQLQIVMQKDIHYQVRAVFFAELGAKWDAMDSVYWYMKNDPRFDPIVVLTPIFRAIELNGKMKSDVIYEDYLTEMGIPFYHFQDYSLENDLPEIAFSSQPYESVTIPQFWAENVVKYTRLVYLWYAIPNMSWKGTRTSWCQLPMHMYAWFIPQFSERFHTYFSQHSVRRGDNSMALGIPKMDYALNLQRKSRHQKDRNHKVFLWCTWYQWEYASIDLLERVVEWVLAHDNCTLIWRPHPMTNSVVKLYAPQHYAQLKRIENLFKNNSCLRYDNCASYEGSFCDSDAMITDTSTMMVQYLMMDKPAAWVKIPGKTLPLDEKEGIFVSPRWMEEVTSTDEIIRFMQSILDGDDVKRQIRSEVMREDMPLADGHVTDRIIEYIWNRLEQECFGSIQTEI